MLTLSLLLSAAAGVNAIAGGNVEAIRLPGKSYICADNCAFQGVFFSQSGFFCPNDDTVVRVDDKGNLDDSWSGTAFQCAGEKVRTGLTTRQPSDGEKPFVCMAQEITTRDYFDCAASKMGGGDGPKKAVEWSDVEKELKLATENKPAPEEAKPQTEKQPTQAQINECGKPAQEARAKCQKTGGTFEECYAKGRKAMEDCLSAL
ncbi:hypothetical protein MY11210_005608 [Beauveria gryllotalpidicola]